MTKKRPTTFVCVVCHRERHMGDNCTVWNSATSHCKDRACCEVVVTWERIGELVNEHD